MCEICPEVIVIWIILLIDLSHAVTIFSLIYQRGTVYTADAGLFLPRCSIACLHLQTVWLGLEFARTQLMIDTGTLFYYNSNKNCFEFDSFISPADNEWERIFLTLQFFSNVQFRHC